MSFDSVMFLALVLLVVGVTVTKLRSEKPEKGSGSSDIIPDFFALRRFIISIAPSRFIPS